MTFSEFVSEANTSAGNRGWSGKVMAKISCNQREILDCIHSGKFTAVYKGKQDGVTTALGLYALWQMLAHPSTHVVLIGHHGVMDKFHSLFRHNSGLFYKLTERKPTNSLWLDEFPQENYLKYF